MSADPRRRVVPPPPPPPPPSEPQPDSSMMGIDGTDERDAQQIATAVEPAKDEESFKLRFCTVCASNNNR